jgi:hypothetical protein
MTAMEIDLVSVYSCCVIVSTSWSWAESFGLIVSIIDIAHIWRLRHRRGVVNRRAKEETIISITALIKGIFLLIQFKFQWKKDKSWHQWKLKFFFDNR